MLKILINVSLMLFSVPIFADCDDSNPKIYSRSALDIALDFYDARVSDVIEYINSECQDRIDPIESSNPEALITLKFEAIPCEGAAAIIKDFDSRAGEI